jgi:hypothetical protein
MTTTKKDEEEQVAEAPPDPAEPGSARRRTLDRVSRLMALAATGAALQGGCSGSPSYMVVDPVPPPPSCPVASGIKATGVWQEWKEMGGGAHVEIKLAKPERADVHYADPEKARPTAEHPAIVGRAALQDGALTFEVLLPDPSRRELTVTVSVECAMGTARVAVDIAARADGGATENGEAVEVTVRDMRAFSN